MKLAASMLLLAALMTPGTVPQEEPPERADDPLAAPPRGVEVSLRLDFVCVGGTYSFELSGTSNLPAGTQLRARVFALSEIEFRGKKEWDEEPMVWDDPITGESAHEPFEVGEGGAFKLRLYEFPKKLFSLPYRGRIFYDPEDQPEKLQAKVPGRMFSVAADRRMGDDDQLAAEIAASTRDIDQDLKKVMDLFEEMKKSFEKSRAQKPPDLKAWGKWREEWLARVDRVRRKNDQRYDLWSVWVERQGKLRIEGFCDSFDRTAQDCYDFLGGDREALPRINAKLQSFVARMEEAREVIGFDAPINPEEVRTLTLEYEKHAAKLDAAARSGEYPRDWAAQSLEIRAGAFRALISLQKHLPRRGYGRVVDLLERFKRLFDGCTGPESERASGAELRRLIEEHHATLKEFRTYAGLK